MVVITLVVNNSSQTGLKPTQQEGNNDYYWKPSQLYRASEVKGLGEEPTTTTFLNKYKP